MSARAVELALAVIGVTVAAVVYLYLVGWLVSVTIKALVFLSPLVAVAGLALVAIGLIKGVPALGEAGAACFAGGGLLWWLTRR